MTLGHIQSLFIVTPGGLLITTRQGFGKGISRQPEISTIVCCLWCRTSLSLRPVASPGMAQGSRTCATCVFDSLWRLYPQDNEPCGQAIGSLEYLIRLAQSDWRLFEGDSLDERVHGSDDPAVYLENSVFKQTGSPRLVNKKDRCLVTQDE